MLGLYVHVPFCSSICNYCNFNRGLFDEAQKSRYVDALLREIASFDPASVVQDSSSAGAGADTIYFGGGTPSLLTAADVSRIISAVRGRFDVTPDAEITLEANPETVDAERLERFASAGINRLSFGVQSFRDDELEKLDRRHSAQRAEEAIAAARAAGFRNISLDLMMWLPEQRRVDWMESVHRAIAIEPDHISLYMLEVYPHLPLRARMSERGWSQLPDDDVAGMYESAMETLERAGYRQYEISNVAQSGFRSRHNLKYWTDGAWAGFGPGAHSTARGRRWKNVSSTDDYVARVTSGATVVAEHRELARDERLGDALFTALRLTDGIDVNDVSQRYGVDVWGTYRERLQPFMDEQLLVKSGSRVRLTRRGMLLAHEVMAVFV